MEYALVVHIGQNAVLFRGVQAEVIMVREVEFLQVRLLTVLLLLDEHALFPALPQIAVYKHEGVW